MPTSATRSSTSSDRRSMRCGVRKLLTGHVIQSGGDPRRVGARNERPCTDATTISRQPTAIAPRATAAAVGAAASRMAGMRIPHERVRALGTAASMAGKGGADTKRLLKRPPSSPPRVPRSAVLLVLLTIAIAGCGSTATKHAGPRRTRPSLVDLPTAPARPPQVAPRAKPRHRVRRSRHFHPTATLITHGPRNGHDVALTFDADMTQAMLAAVRRGHRSIGYDPEIVRELRASHTPATIFMTGLWPTAHPGPARDLTSDPLFEIDNHTYDHSAFAPPCYGLPTVPSAADKNKEIQSAAQVIAGLIGSEPRYFRVPGACHSPSDLHLVASLGEQPVQWDVISGDAYLREPAAVARQTLAGVRPGSVVVMHLVGAPNAPATAAALRTVLPALRQRGLRPVKLARLLGG